MSYFYGGGSNSGGLTQGHLMAVVLIGAVLLFAVGWVMLTAGVDGTTLAAGPGGRPRIDLPPAYQLPDVRSEGAARARGWAISAWEEWIRHLQSTGQLAVGAHPDAGTMMFHRFGRQVMIFSNWCAPKFSAATGIFLLTLLVVGVGVALSGVSFLAEDWAQVTSGALAAVCAGSGLIAVAGHPVVGDSWSLASRWWMMAAAELVAVVGFVLIGWVAGRITWQWVKASRIKYSVTIGASEIIKLPAFIVGRRKMEILPSIPAALARVTGKDEIKVPVPALRHGVGAVGGMGSGKTRFIFGIIDQFRAMYPTVPVFCYDKKCDYLSRYHSDEHLIYAPFDSRGTPWDILGTLAADAGLRAIAAEAAVISNMGTQQQDRTWVLGAMNVVEDVIKSGGVEASTARLKQIIQQCNDAGDRTRQSMVTCARGALRDIFAIANQAAASGKPARPLADFLNHPGFIFLTNPHKIATRQAASINIFLSVALAEMLSMPDVPPSGTPRALFILDEILTLRLPPELTGTFFRTVRSKGIAFVCASQEAPNERAQHIMEWWGACERNFLFRVNDDTTAEKMSKRIGKAIYDEKTKSETSRSIIERMSTTDAMQERYHLLFEPSYFKTFLQPRDFIALHPSGIVPGMTVDVADRPKQAEDLIQANRDDIIEWERMIDEVIA